MRLIEPGDIVFDRDRWKWIRVGSVEFSENNCPFSYWGTDGSFNLVKHIVDDTTIPEKPQKIRLEHGEHPSVEPKVGYKELVYRVPLKAFDFKLTYEVDRE